MHPLIEVCMQNDMPTRVVEVSLAVELSPCKDRSEFQSEYDRLGYSTESLKNFFENLEYRDKGENAVILEILFEMYKKILNIEQQLMPNKPRLILLEKKDEIKAVGHEVLWLDSGGLVAGEDYYLRFILPGFSDKITAVFAKALSERALRITTMNRRDTQEFDLFIATREMDLIRQNREAGKK